MTDKEKIIKELKEALDSLDITNKYRLNLIRAIEYLQEEPVSDDLEEAAITVADKDMQGRQIMEESNENRQLYSRIFRRGFKDGAKWQKQQEYTCYEEAFEDGAKWKYEQMLKDAFECEVKVDAGGYPYIPQMELYDYDKDIPLAKEGDKYKVILIEED